MNINHGEDSASPGYTMNRRCICVNVDKLRERINFLYNYHFVSLSDLIEELKPITDNLLEEIEKLRQETK